MESESTLPHSQVPATCPYPEPDIYTCTYIHNPYIHTHIHSSIYTYIYTFILSVFSTSFRIAQCCPPPFPLQHKPLFPVATHLTPREALSGLVKGALYTSYEALWPVRVRHRYTLRQNKTSTWILTTGISGVRSVGCWRYLCWSCGLRHRVVW